MMLTSRLMYWSPTGMTRPWLPAIFTGTDEHCNRSVSVKLPFLGALIFFWEPHMRRCPDICEKCMAEGWVHDPQTCLTEMPHPHRC